jgi:hypothetical protein
MIEFRGCYTAIVTPFTSDGIAVDETRLAEHIAFQADGSMEGAACWRADGTAIGLGGGLARAGVRFWPDRARA